MFKAFQLPKGAIVEPTFAVVNGLRNCDFFFFQNSSLKIIYKTLWIIFCFLLSVFHSYFHVEKRDRKSNAEQIIKSTSYIIPKWKSLSTILGCNRVLKYSFNACLRVIGMPPKRPNRTSNIISEHWGESRSEIDSVLSDLSLTPCGQVFFASCYGFVCQLRSNTWIQELDKTKSSEEGVGLGQVPAAARRYQ